MHRRVGCGSPSATPSRSRSPMTRSTPRDLSAPCNGLLTPRRPSTARRVVRPGGASRSSTPTGQPSASMSATQGSGPWSARRCGPNEPAPSNVGSRLGDLARAADLTDVRRRSPRRSGTSGTPTSHRHQMGASPCRAWRRISSTGANRPGRRGPLRLDRSRRRPAGTVLDVPDDVHGDHDGAASGCLIVPGQPSLEWLHPAWRWPGAWPQSSCASVPPFGRRHVAWDPQSAPRGFVRGGRQVVSRLPSKLLTLRTGPTLVAVQSADLLGELLRTPHPRSSSVRSLLLFVAIEAHYPSAKRLSPPSRFETNPLVLTHN